MYVPVEVELQARFIGTTSLRQLREMIAFADNATGICKIYMPTRTATGIINPFFA